MFLESKYILILGGVFGALAVIFGAFGAHALKSQLTPAMLDVFETGVKYQSWHATVLLFLGAMSMLSPDPAWRLSATFITVGMVLFSFSLYGLAFGGPRWLGPVTPLGGLLMIVGWLVLVYAAWNFRIEK